MSRIFCIPGILFLVAAFVLQVLVSISLPFLPAMDITRVHFNGQQSVSNSAANGPASEVRFGIWAACVYSAQNGDRTCSATHHAYQVTLQNGNESSTIQSSWTRGLVIHPVAAAVIFIALILSFSTHVTITLLSSLISFLAALITLIVFAVDIALFAFVKHEVGTHLGGTNSNTDAGPGFWMTLATFILLLLAGCTVCFGRRRDRGRTAASYPATTTTKRPFFSRFRRGRATY